MTATPAQNMDCNIPDCKKQKKDGYKTKVGLTNHMKRWHQAAKYAFSPIADTARTLFQGTEDETLGSTQGNSRGEVNVLKVVSCGTFVCGVCDKSFTTKKEMGEHMETHDAAIIGEKPDDDPEEDNTSCEIEEDLDRCAKEIENLVVVDRIVENFLDIAFRAMRPSEAPETTKSEDDYNLLFRKYTKMSDNNTVLTRANQNRLEVIKEMENLRSKAESSDEDLQITRKTNQGLEERLKVKDTEIEALEEIIINLKKKAELDASKALDQTKNIRALEEELGVGEEEEDEEEVTELQNEWVSDDARRHNEIIFKCKKCNYKTNVETKLLGHMTKHNGYVCNKCNKNLKSQGELNDHILKEHNPQLLDCTKCSKQFTAKNALSQHMNSQHPENPPVGHSQWAQQKNNSHDYSCTQCSRGFENLQELKEHKKTKHNNQNSNGLLMLDIPCRFFKQGRCNKELCRFSHKQQNNREFAPECTRGQQCQFFAWGSCNFFHKGVGVQQPKKQQNLQRQSMQQQNMQQRNMQQSNMQQQNRQQEENKRCHFQDRCWNQNCKFMHEDFSLGKSFQENY